MVTSVKQRYSLLAAEQLAIVLRIRTARIAARRRIFHPNILRIDGRNKTSPIIARNARKSNCCFL